MLINQLSNIQTVILVDKMPFSVEKLPKIAQKAVKNVAENWWTKNVDNLKMWTNSISKLLKMSKTTSFSHFFQNLLDSFYTTKNVFSYLLNLSFTRFAHRTINTTTIFIRNF